MNKRIIMLIMFLFLFVKNLVQFSRIFNSMKENFSVLDKEAGAPLDQKKRLLSFSCLKLSQNKQILFPNIFCCTNSQYKFYIVFLSFSHVSKNSVSSYLFFVGSSTSHSCFFANVYPSLLFIHFNF